MKAKVRRFRTADELGSEAAKFIVYKAIETIKTKGAFNLCLSGGNSPRIMFKYLTDPLYQSNTLWKYTHLFWGDERCVPPDHPDSNFRSAYEGFISRVPIPPENIHRVSSEVKPAERAAALYERSLREFFKNPERPGFRTLAISEGKFFPSFDITILGVGNDGHTASLYPGHPILNERIWWVAAVQTPGMDPPVKRITITLPVINSSDTVMFLAPDNQKRDVVTSIIKDRENVKNIYPAANVETRNELLWFIGANVLA